jgi:hypothetical protein
MNMKICVFTGSNRGFKDYLIALRTFMKELRKEF